MPYYAGWEAVITIEGSQTKEILEDGGASTDTNVEYISAHYPIVDSGGTVTDDATDITVYQVTDAGVESVYASGNVTLDGSEGSITLASTTANYSYYVTYESAETVAHATGIEWEFKNNLEEIHTMGQRKAREIKEGKINVNWKLDLLYSENRQISWGVAQQAPNYQNNSYTITHLTASSGGGSFEIQDAKVGNIKFASKIDSGVAVSECDGLGTWVELATT